MPTTLLSRPGEIESDAPVDLRRRRDRSQADVIVSRLGFLPPDEASLLRAIFEQGASVRQVAALREEPARRVRRRVRAIATRALSRRFEFVLRRRAEWPPTRRRVADAYVLRGRTLRETAAELRLSFHCVRRHVEAINTLCEQAGV